VTLVLNLPCSDISSLPSFFDYKIWKGGQMDLDTAILLAMTVCAYLWFVSIGIFQEKKEIKAREREEVERLQRQERLRKLFGR
jgi:hypothetical protein